MINYIKKYYISILLLFFGLLLSFNVASFLAIQRNSNKVYSVDDPALDKISKTTRIGIVFGGGVTDTEPLPLVRERLDMAKKLLEIGYIDKVLLSGDNRELSYNEPAVMYDYLVDELKVNPNKLQVDYAGRSTFETCERASKVFGISEAILISESIHLPRAIYLCENFGIKSYGVPSDGQASGGLQIGQRWRELLARNKAIFNVYVVGEQTVLGDPININ